MGVVDQPEPRHERDIDRSADLFIDGEFRAPAENEYYDIENPYTHQIWAQAPRATEADVDTAVEAARTTFESDEWQNLTPMDRAALLNEMADVADDHAEELAELSVRENGRTITDMEAEAKGMSRWFRYYADLCTSELEGRTIPVENKGGSFFTFVEKEPHGVVAGITPWNAPVINGVMKLAPAIAAGNTFVHKPSEHTPISILRFAELLAKETSLPDGAYNVVPGFGMEAGAPLAGHPDIDMVAFTGGGTAGRNVAASAGENVNRAMVELGGKSPTIVFPSANLENTANGVIKGIFQSSGEACTAGSRLLVHESVRDELLELIVDRVENVTIGDPMDRGTDMGPLAFGGHAEAVKGYIEQSEASGLEVTSIGDLPDDAASEYFVRPTMITGVENDDTVAREEIFGPVLSVITFDDEETAIEIANDTEYGLAAGIWTEDMRQAYRAADEIRAGAIWINEYRQLTYTAPFGGMKNSGIGRQDGKEGLEEYLQTKTVWMDLSGEVPRPFSEHTIVQDD